MAKRAVDVCIFYDQISILQSLYRLGCFRVWPAKFAVLSSELCTGRWLYGIRKTYSVQFILEYTYYGSLVCSVRVKTHHRLDLQYIFIKQGHTGWKLQVEN